MQPGLAQKIVSTTYDVLAQNGLQGWTVELGHAKRTAGTCHYKEQKIRISLAIAKISPWEDTFETILHEVAHALAGSAAGHGWRWQKIAREIGLKNPTRTSYLEGTEKIDPWVGTCPAGHVSTRAGAPRKVRACGLCSPVFSLDNKITWKKNGQEVLMPASYRKELELLTMRHTMKELREKTSA